MSGLTDSETAGRSVDVLHVAYTYFPDPVGGTETYLAGLVRGLRARGISSAIAAPDVQGSEGAYEGTPVFRFARAQGASLPRAYGAADEVAAQSFKALVARLRPAIIHLHARTSAMSERLVDVAQEAGAKVVFTYHTPTVSCARGTLMRMGREPCDGVLDAFRCSRCVLDGHGLRPGLSRMIASTPSIVGQLFGAAGLSGWAFTAFRLPALVAASHRQFKTMMDRADRIVAVCDWVGVLLVANGVPPAKITASRQGAVRNASAGPVAVRGYEGPVKIGYFGRLDATKGPDLLVEAFARLPGLAMRLEIYGVRPDGSEAYHAALAGAAALDDRITIRPALPPDQIEQAMSECDLVAVPSNIMETGPMVVLEAFGSGAPVLGARVGGIAELVRDGVDGLLLAPANAQVWADALADLVAHPERIARFRAAIRPPRTIEAVADDMVALYDGLLGRSR